MNNRLCAVATVMTLIVCSTGCSGMKNFLFGRGARCGLCTKLGSCLPAPRLGNVAPAPVPPPACPVPACSAPTCSAPPAVSAPASRSVPGCGCNAFAGPVHGVDAYASGRCETCEGFHVHSGTAGASLYSDPYLNGATQYGGPPLAPGEQIIDVQTLPPSVVPGQPNFTAPIQPDNFSARRFDADGNRILWEEPAQPGTNSL